MAARRLDEATWPEVAALDRPVLVVPLGSTEQHGPHLPLGTDTLIAEAISKRVVDARPSFVLGPTISIGASGEHAGFAGTLSIGTPVLSSVLLELSRSARASFRAVLVISAHGGNRSALRTAAARARADGDLLLGFEPHLVGADAHAGHTETSLLLALAPSLVRHDEVVTGTTTPIEELAEALTTSGVIAVSTSGVLGDPTAATHEHGEELLDVIVTQALAHVDRELVA